MGVFPSLDRDTVNTVPLIPPSGANGVATPLLFYVVPDFVSAAMRRAKLNTVDISRFGALSNVLTSEDFANWALEVDQVNRLNIQNISVLEPSVGLENYWQNVTSDERSYIQREILPLMKFPQNNFPFLTIYKTLQHCLFISTLLQNLPPPSPPSRFSVR